MKGFRAPHACYSDSNSSVGKIGKKQMLRLLAGWKRTSWSVSEILTVSDFKGIEAIYWSVAPICKAAVKRKLLPEIWDPPPFAAVLVIPQKRICRPSLCNMFSPFPDSVSLLRHLDLLHSTSS